MVEGKFDANTVYSAAVILTADNNHKFSSSAAATVGAASGTGNTGGGGDVAGNTLSFTATVAQTLDKEITGISFKS